MPSWPGIHRHRPSVNFHTYEVDFKLPAKKRHTAWIIDAFEAEGFDLDRVDFIFCSDNYLLQINQTHLGHDDYTDIITFPFEENPVIGEIYISIERVRENADSFDMPFEEELRRVMIHGVLHLCGYDDHEEDDINEIRDKEEQYLEAFRIGSEE